MLRRTALVALAAFAAAGLAFAQPPAAKPAPKPKPPEASLKVGAKAPELKVSNWVKGSEVKTFAPGKAYVVEFWATWCGPCKKSIPHLTEMAQAHKDLTVIGVSVWEESHQKGADKGTLLSTVQNFVKGQGDKMNYTVAFDGDKFMEKNWLQAAGRNGIPAAFVIGGDGKIAWIGNPLADDFAGAVESALKTAGGSAAKPAEKPKG